MVEGGSTDLETTSIFRAIFCYSTSGASCIISWRRPSVTAGTVPLSPTPPPPPLLRKSQTARRLSSENRSPPTAAGRSLLPPLCCSWRRRAAACAGSRRISFEAFFGGGGKDVGRLSVSALPTGQEDIAPSAPPLRLTRPRFHSPPRGHS